MNSLPEFYPSAMHLPFNKACLAEQFVLQGPCDDPGGPGYGVLLRGNQMLALKASAHVTLPWGEWAGHPALYLGLWQGQVCRLVDLINVKEVPDNLEMFGLLDEKPQLPIELLSLGGLGRMILHWQERSRFCGYCGQSKTWLPGEWAPL